jgi:hypothetical protein
VEETTAAEMVARLAQKCFSSNPVVILGSGASLPHGLPFSDQPRACERHTINAAFGAATILAVILLRQYPSTCLAHLTNLPEWFSILHFMPFCIKLPVNG